MSQEQDDTKRLCDAVNALSDFFDTVQIFTTRHESNDIGTIAFQRGSGNWYARFGQIKEWVIKREEETKEIIRHPPEE